MKTEKPNRWKTRILSASSKIWKWKSSKYFDKDLRQAVLSAKKNKKEEKNKEKQQQNLTFLSELYERRKDTPFLDFGFFALD